MIFNTFAYYFCYLIPSAILFRLLPANLRAWSCVLFGFAFFIHFSLELQGNWWGPACLALLVWEGLFRNLYQPGSRWCLLGIWISILTLGVFKYWNFCTDTACGGQGNNPLHWQEAFLPLGISFFTFEFIHYAYDRYQGKTAKGSTAEYFAFIFFFPTMVAGPIKRFQDFLPCIQNPSKDWALDWNRGITRILCGLVKKFMFADFLTSLTDHLNREDVSVAPRWALLLWLFSYGWKIYFDFSAYSDIAIGSGRLFGIKIPENFNWPYFARNIAEFWKRWHISLYKWLVDYVFIPLGGSRGGQAKTLGNIAIVMLVSGLWHGAAFNFILWGAWHAGLLILHRIWTSSPFAQRVTTYPRVWSWFSWVTTYTLVNLGWAFFVMDSSTALLFFKRLIAG